MILAPSEQNVVVPRRRRLAWSRAPRPGHRRLLHVTASDISLALLLAPQLDAFADAGYDVYAASAAGEWAPRLAERGIVHVPLRHSTRAWSPVRDVLAFVELFRLFRRLRPDIVHTHNPKPGVYGRIAARLARVPAVVNTVHGLYALPSDRWAKRTAVYGLERLAATCSDVELVQGPEDLEVLASIGIPRSKLRRLGNGIDLARFDPAAVGPGVRDRIREEIGAGPDDVVCGVVARLVREKGIPEVVAAARILLDEPDVVVVVIGPREPDKADGVSDAEIDEAMSIGVRFLGLRHDVVDCLASMDVFILASHREGFPRSPMEAAAMGLPVVATDVRGCREVVDDGVTGLLVPVRSPEAIAAAVRSLARDPERRRAMGDAGRAKAASEFDDRRVIAISLEAYEAVLAG